MSSDICIYGKDGNCNECDRVDLECHPKHIFQLKHPKLFDFQKHYEEIKELRKQINYEDVKE